MPRGRPRGGAVDRLLTHLLDDPASDGSDETAVDLAAWLSASPRFLSFAEAHRDKIRKKLRGAVDPAARGDVRAELETAFRLLGDRRIDLAFEAYGAGRRGPDFTVTFRAVHRFNLEVTRRRPEVDPTGPDGPGREGVDWLASALLGKLRQLPADAPNAVLVAVDGPPVAREQVATAARSLKQRADRRDDRFFAARGFAAARELHLYYRRLGTVFVVGRDGLSALSWSNGEARRPLPDGAEAACLGCLAATRQSAVYTHRRTDAGVDPARGVGIE
jgi:hypothetical protein